MLNHLGKFQTMKNKPLIKTTFILVLLCLCILIPDLTHAQDKGIYEISNTTNLSSKDRKDFYDLAFNLKTTLYLKNNKIQSTYGDGSVVKITIQDTKSFAFLEVNQNQYKQAEIITIKVNSINELSNTIDLTTLTAINNLKYVFIKCAFNCQLKDIENFIEANPNIRVFYNAENPS